MAAWRMSTATVCVRLVALPPDFSRGQAGGGNGGLRRGADAEGRGQYGIGAGQPHAIERCRIAAGDRPEVSKNSRRRCAAGLLAHGVSLAQRRGSGGDGDEAMRASVYAERVVFLRKAGT